MSRRGLLIGLLFWALIILGIVGIGRTAPYLVCDPQADVTEYQGIRNGVPFTTPYSLHASGGAIIFDLQGLPSTEIEDFTEIKACNARGCSTVVTFVVPGVPSAPANIRLVQ